MEKETEIKPVMCIEVMDLTLFFLNLPGCAVKCICCMIVLIGEFKVIIKAKSFTIQTYLQG